MTRVNQPEHSMSSVKMHTINPKSISYGQLYGMFDANTREWVEVCFCEIEDG